MRATILVFVVPVMMKMGYDPLRVDLTLILSASAR
jgi:hypothetical protein